MTKAYFTALLMVFTVAACKNASLREPAADSINDSGAAATPKEIKEPGKEKLSKEEKDLIKRQLKNLTPQEREAYLAHARPFRPKYSTPDIAKIDVVAELQDKCGANFKYTKTANGYLWPTITCNYSPDDHELSGQSQKFLCEIADPSKEDGKDSVKIKYSKQQSKPLEDKAEVFDSFVTTSIARLLGFYAETYCPAKISCVGCPSQTPWENDRASAPASDKTYNFPWSIAESALKGNTITTAGPHKKPFGIAWEELKVVTGDTPGAVKQTLIEREAWMLWIILLQHEDADPHNQRLLCRDPKPGEPPTCDKIAAYTHDYGLSFNRMSTGSWMKKDVFPRKSCQGKLAKELFGPHPSVNREGDASLLAKAEISKEARDLLVQRMEAIKDEQWLTIFSLGQTETLKLGKPSQWLAAFKAKIANMKAAPCRPFDEGKSVLAQRH